jgi:hypothetical protein
VYTEATLLLPAYVHECAYSGAIVYPRRVSARAFDSRPIAHRGDGWLTLASKPVSSITPDPPSLLPWQPRATVYGNEIPFIKFCSRESAMSHVPPFGDVSRGGAFNRIDRSRNPGRAERKSRANKFLMNDRGDSERDAETPNASIRIFPRLRISR